jgi:hypothetical protein
MHGELFPSLAVKYLFHALVSQLCICNGCFILKSQNFFRVPGFPGMLFNLGIQGRIRPVYKKTGYSGYISNRLAVLLSLFQTAYVGIRRLLVGA